MPLQADQNGEITVIPSSSKTSIRSEAMDEIFSRQPGALSRWSLLFIVLLLTILTAVAWYVHYPDIVTTRAKLTGMNAPKEIIARQEGKLVRLFVKNGDRVNKNQVLGWLESNADPLQMIVLSARIDSALSFLSTKTNRKLNGLFTKNFSHLGELQDSYQQFITAYQQFEDYFINGYYRRQNEIMHSDLISLKKTAMSLDNQRQLMQQDLDLSKISYSANASLYKDSVISSMDYRNEQSKIISKQLTIPQVEDNILANEIQQRDKEKEISDLNHSFSQQAVIFQQALQTLKSILEDWKRKYLLTSPIDGKIVFIEPIQENRFLKTDQSIGFVNPPQSQFYLEINLPQDNFGKVSVGQNVQLRFDAYPYNEFGFVNGKLSFISEIATDSGFIAQVSLPNGLHTTEHKEIQFKNGLSADALVITKDINVLQRLYYGIVKGVNQQ
ncbi:MAG TPA: HlyD family efflux transporter periplasmic adaptor subunit [Puia sp.]|nr:HlyD family efflux transporter periplasmic adaptor subunit [Puia sp.]